MKITRFEDCSKIFKLFTMSTLLTCGPGSLKVLFKGPAKPKKKPLITVITFSIYPELTRIWYYFMDSTLSFLKAKNIDAEMLVVDCAGGLDKNQLPNALVERFVNERHSRKLDFFIKRYFDSKLVLITDDDCFMLEPGSIMAAVDALLNEEKLAAYSLFPRPDWNFTINGEPMQPLGSYCVVYDREILIKERLSFGIPNVKNPHNGRPYDTGDFLNEQLLNRGYRAAVIDNQAMTESIGGFRAASMHRIIQWGATKEGIYSFFMASSKMKYDTRVVYLIKSFYTGTKINTIYKNIYGDAAEPSMFSEHEWVDFIKALPEGKFKSVLAKDFRAIDSVAEKILSAGKRNSHVKRT